MEQESKSVFETLSNVNCNEHTEKKNGLTYLSWAWAWAEVKKKYPNATYTVYETPNGRIYWDDGRTAWVKTGVTINGLEHIEYLPVLDAASKRSLPLESITSWDVNKAIQRSLTKAVARHGLGLYIYAGEDLPEGEEEPKKAEKPETNPNDPPTPHTVAVAKSLNIELDKVAAYYNKSVEFLTEGELNKAIEMKLKSMEGKKSV